MAKVILPRPLAAELFGGREVLEVAGKTLFAVIHGLEAQGSGRHAGAGGGVDY